MSAKKAPKTESKSASTVAKSEDGTIQITFTIAWHDIESGRLRAVKELGSTVEVPGFRPGKAPADKIAEKIPENKLLEAILAKILPKLFSDAIQSHKINPTIYPRFDLISAKENEDWQVRATTCEIPPFDLGDYKSILKKSAQAKIWVPGKDKADKELSTVEKEAKAIETLLEAVKVIVPSVLIEEEINSRLSSLLERIEKLGLKLESYLTSIGKTPQSIREDYGKQAKNSLALELILSKIAQEENINPDDKEIEAALQAGAASNMGQEKNDPVQQKRLITEILKRRKVLDNLIALV